MFFGDWLLYLNISNKWKNKQGVNLSTTKISIKWQDGHEAKQGIWHEGGWSVLEALN
jgi:hypothetical protein